MNCEQRPVDASPARVATGSALQRFRERVVGDATPGALGAIRIVTCGVALLNALWENLPSAAQIPPQLRVRMGLLDLFYRLPIGFGSLVESSLGLSVLKWGTALALLLAMLGYRTRLSLPLATVGCFLSGGILRQYAWFFHTGLVPLYVLSVLCFTPCADGYSLDVERRRRRAEVVPDADLATPAYGWARYACWLVISLPYVFAAMSKLRAGPPMWWVAENFKRLVLGSNLKPMEFNWDVGLAILRWPDWAWSLMGFGAVATELAYGSVLISRRARRIMPPLTAVLHVGILLFQNILFFDLILLQLAFFDFDRLRRAGGAPSRVPPSAQVRRTDVRAAAVLASLTLFLTGWWVLNVDYYPFTAMKMFAGKVSRSTTVGYQLIFARRRSGESFEARLEDVIPVLHDTRYREYLAVFGKNERRKERTRKLLDVAAAVWNRDAPAGSEVVEFEIQNRAWNFKAQADDPAHGKIVERFLHKVR